MIGVFISKIKVIKGFEQLSNHELDKIISSWRDDCILIYPGDVAGSGRFEGKTSIRNWFQNFFEQFPGLKFTVRNICVDRIFDFTGTNTIAVYWEVDVTNRKGVKFHNRGFTKLNLKFGKITKSEDFFFDTGSGFKNIWSA